MSFKVDAERFLELTDRPGYRPGALPGAGQDGCYVDQAPTRSSDDETAACCAAHTSLIFARLTKKLQRDIGESAT